MNPAGTLRLFAHHRRTLGVRAALRMAGIRRTLARPGAPIRVWPAGLDHALHVRRGTTDIDVFQQIFVEREYACLDARGGVDLVLDCGANVGYSSAYFLSRFPGARVVAVEPDAGNVEALRRNLAPYGCRARIVQAGVWSHAADLVVSDEIYRDGGEWARQVRPSRPGEAADLRGIDIATLLAEADADRISILKVDIEGAEAVVFAEGYEGWIDRVDAIAIELHDDTSFGDATRIFYESIRGRGFDVTHSGELTICLRPTVEDPSQAPAAAGE